MLGVMKTFFRIWSSKAYCKRYAVAIFGGLLSLVLLPILLLGIVGLCAFYIIASVIQKLED